MGGLGSLAGGIAGGLGQGVGIADQLRQLQEAARVRAARRALGNSYAMSDDPMGGAPAPPAPVPIPTTGQTPMPGQQSMPAAPPPPGAMSPDPMMGLPTGGAPMPPQAAPPMPAPVAAPPPAAPPTGAEGTPLSAQAAPVAKPEQAAGMAVITDANDTIKSIAAQVKKANPGIDPETLFEATRQHIENMKGVRNEVKDYMVLQTEYAKLQHSTELTQAKLSAAAEAAATAAHAKVEVANINKDARLGAAETSAGARVDSAQIGADSRVTVGAGHDAATMGSAGTRADASRYGADQKLRGTKYNATSRDATAADTARVAAQGRVDAASAGMGGKPTNRYAKPSTAAAPAYKSAAAVAAAYKAGKIDRNTAASILKKQFGAQ